MMMRLALALCLLASPVLAEKPLTADEFDRLTQGRILSWREFGQTYGVEQYLPDRTVRWTFVGDDCKTGHWYPVGEAICFQYEDRDSPVCWVITAPGGTIEARLVGNPPDWDPVLLEDMNEPLACFGPEVGV
jgi:hypothetical protein